MHAPVPATSMLVSFPFSLKDCSLVLLWILPYFMICAKDSFDREHCSRLMLAGGMEETHAVREICAAPAFEVSTLAMMQRQCESVCVVT